jgi:hypothetical protein
VASASGDASIRPFHVEIPQEKPDARRRHHDDLGDEHQDLLGSPVLGEHARFLPCQGRDGPAAVSVFLRELYQASRSWAEQAYPNLIYFNKLDRGNHFAAWQEPDLFTTEIRAAFTSLR